MEQSAFQGKRILIIGGILLVIVLAVITTILSNKGVTQKLTTPSTPSAQVTPATGDSLAFQPATGAKYSGLGDVNFLPSKVNNITLDKEALFQQAKKEYPNASEQELISTMNEAILSWLAMNNYYANFEPKQVSTMYKVDGTLNNFSDVEKDYRQQLTDYVTREIKLGGFYIKVRFAGVKDDNLQKLGKKESELEPLAKSIIDHYSSEAEKFRDKERIVEFLNADDQVMLMNNGEKSQVFTDRKLFPPLVSDPSYYTWAQRLLVGQFSDMITLKDFNAETGSQQNYAYAKFYLSKKEGNRLPVNIVTDQFITNATIQ